MNLHLTGLALFQLLLSLLLGVGILYLTYEFLKRVFARRYGIGHDNLAFAIFAGAVLFAVGFVVSSASQPLLSTLRLLAAANDDLLATVGQFSLYLVGFFGLSALVALLANLCAIWLYTRLTRVREAEEMQRGNVAVALVTAVIVVVMALFVRDGVGLLLESIVPYPDMPLSPR